MKCLTVAVGASVGTVRRSDLRPARRESERGLFGGVFIPLELETLMYLETDEDLDRVLTPQTADAPPLEQIYVGIPSRCDIYKLINRYAADNPFHRMGFRAGQWFEVPEDIYWHFLEALPPLHMTGAGFVVGECTMDDLYHGFVEIEGRFFCAVIDWQGPRSLAAFWTALLAEVAP